MNMLTAAGGLLFLVLLADVHTAHVNNAGAPKPLKKTSSSSDSTPNLDYAEFLGQWRQKVHDIRKSDIKLKDFSALYNVDLTAAFDCVPQPPSSPVPTSVHALRPSDIRVVGALGDSITAGNGVRANNLAQVAFTNRGESWSIGGEKSLELRVLTFPNILRKFRPDLTGDSICRRSANDKPWSSLNVAVAGDTNRGMKAQAENVMLKMLENPDIDYYNDWKVITIFIGGNDLCRHCLNDAYYGPDAYYQGIKDALDLFYNHLPRALINVQPMFDISIIHQAFHTNYTLQCAALHRLDCPCAVGRDAKNVTQLREVQMAYFDKMVQLTSGRYDLRKDFTVVLQPHLRDLGQNITTLNESLFAPDCFHPSHVAHQGFAYMLWNTMLTPVGQKPYLYNVNEPRILKCPSEAAPYFYTNCNSGNPPAYCSYPTVAPPVIEGVSKLDVGIKSLVLTTAVAVFAASRLFLY